MCYAKDNEQYAFLFQNFYDNKWAYAGVKAALMNGQLMSTSIFHVSIRLNVPLLHTRKFQLPTRLNGVFVFILHCL